MRNVSNNVEYVRVKDLKAGCIYYSGDSPWRNTYCYLGRTLDNGFLWLYIGNPEAFVKDTSAYICDYFYGGTENIFKTKNNKKVCLLSSSAVKSFIAEDYACLVRFKADLTYVRDYLQLMFNLV